MTPAHITLGVSDLGESERFYRDMLGMEVERAGDTVVVRFRDFTLILDSAPPAARAKFAIGFRADDGELDHIAQQIRSTGGQVLAGPAAREGGGRELRLMDPDHYQLEIFSAA